jgi:pre ATP-grasp domain-containing protein
MEKSRHRAAAQGSFANPTQSYEYRISHLADRDDMLLLSGNRNEAFEHYREHSLGLGRIDAITLSSRPSDDLIPLATRCLLDPNALNRIVARAQKIGTLTILPYIGKGSTWLLAAAVAERSGVPVRVAAPPPKLAARVNDKVWFAHLLDEVLGPRAQPLYRAVFGPAALAARAFRFARESERIVIKVPDSAGSDGNLSLRASEIQDLSPGVLRERLILMLTEIGWRNEYPLLVEIWDTPVPPILLFKCGYLIVGLGHQYWKACSNRLSLDLRASSLVRRRPHSLKHGALGLAKKL